MASGICSIFIILSLVYMTNGADFFGIRFAPATSIYANQRDGIIELLDKDGKWGAVCNYGFGALEAATACYMLGYQAQGVSVANSGRFSSNSIIVSDFNCTGRPTTDLNNCAYRYGTNNVPSTCTAEPRKMVVHVACLTAKRTDVVTQPPVVTVPTVDCSQSNSTSTLVKLDPANAVEGRLLVNQASAWGTVCALGFTREMAQKVCSLICRSATALEYAQAILYQYQGGTGTKHVVSLNCPAQYTNVTQCTLGLSPAPINCSHALDVGVRCGPVWPTPAPMYPPTMECVNNSAIVAFNKTVNEDLNSTMVDVTPRPASCQAVTAENDTHIFITIPLSGCGPPPTWNNSHIFITHTILRQVIAVNYAFNKVPTTIQVTCVYPRNDTVDTNDIGAKGATMGPLVEVDRTPVTLKIYLDQVYKSELPMPAVLSVGQTIYGKVSLVNPLDTMKLVLVDCWATPTSDPAGSPLFWLLQNKCIKYSGLTLLPISNSEIGFSLRVFQLGSSSNQVANTNAKMSPIYLHCNTLMCQVADPSSTCNRFCSTSGRRRKRSINDRPSLRLDQGPLYVYEKDGAKSVECLRGILLLVVALVVIHMH